MPNNKITFKTELLTDGKTVTSTKVPVNVFDQLGNGKRPPVKVTIN